jgi:hypothetical protein
MTIPFVIRNGFMKLLGTGGRNHHGVGFDLNDTDVVGETGERWYSNSIATRWNSRNRRLDLTREYFDQSWSYTTIQGINRDGNMVGYGSGGAWLLRHPVAGTAVPEPSALALVAAGLFGWAVQARRSERRGLVELCVGRW